MNSPDLVRIKKIAELAKRGIGGEASNAQKILERLLKENGLTLEALHDSQPKLRSFKALDEFEVRLLRQITAQVLNTTSYRMGYLMRKGRKVKDSFGIELSDSQYIEIEMRFELYKSPMKKHLELSFHAFIQANDIFCDSTRKKQSDLSEEDLTNALRVLKMAKEAEVVKVHKQIADA